MLDASAVLALLQGEPGADFVEAELEGARLSAANLAEVLGKAVDRGLAPEHQRDLIAALGIAIEPVLEIDAVAAADVRRTDHAAGPPVLSLGDRLCLALATRLGATVLTADTAWSGRTGPVEVRFIR